MLSTLVCKISHLNISPLLRKTVNKMLSYRRQIAPQGGLVTAQNGRLELGDNTLRTLQVYLQALCLNWSAKQSNSVGKKRKIRAITPLKVIQGNRFRY